MPKRKPIKREQLLQILEVSESTSEEEVHRSYRRLAARLHPDMGGEKDRFHQLQDAYEQLLKLLERDRKQAAAKPAATAVPASPPRAPHPPAVPPGMQPQPFGPGRPSRNGRSTAVPTNAPGRPSSNTFAGGASSARSPNAPLGTAPRRSVAAGENFLTRKLPLQDATTNFILVNVLDIFATYVLLRLGAIEANPLANYIFQLYNFRGMLWFKLILVALVCVIAQVVAVTSIRKASFLLGFGTVLVGAVVAYSALIILPKLL